MRLDWSAKLIENSRFEQQMSRKPEIRKLVRAAGRAHCVSRLMIVLWVLIAAAASAGEVDRKPNILFVVADDLGWADVGWHGSRHKTPVLDRLVREGVELDQHYVQPVCTPTRVALMTGRYPSRFGPHVMTPSNRRALPLGTETLPSALRRQGYFTALSGKWHLGSRPEWGPNHYGFDHSYGSLPGAADPWTRGYREGPYAQTWHLDGKRLDEKGNTTELIARQAEKWIREKRAPWFIYVAFHAVHIPVDAPDEYKSLYDGVKFYDEPDKDHAARRYAAFTSQLDAKVGQFIAALDETGQRQRTLVIFTSDNGGLLRGGNPYISSVKPTPVLGSNLPLRGQKNQLYEGGIRVCAFVNWPGRLSPRKVTAPMHAVDWFPTLAMLTGYAPEGDLHWDGRNVWSQLTGAPATGPRTFYWALPNQVALREGNWKLIETRSSTATRAELFDLAADPYEKTDMAEQEDRTVTRLRGELDRTRQADKTELPEDLKNFPP